MKKILFVLGSFYPAQEGGPDNTLFWLGKSLVQSAVDVTVYTTEKGVGHDVKKNECVNQSGIKVFYFKYFFSHLLSLNLVNKFIRNIRDFDVVHLTSIFYPMTLLCAMLCVLFNVPFTLSPRGELNSGALVYNSRLKKVYMKFALFFYKKAKYYISTCDSERQEINFFFGNDARVEVLKNYLDDESFSVPDNIINSDKSDYFLYLGRIHQKKNIESLINAYQSLDVKIKDKYSLLIAGTGKDSYLSELKSLSYDSNIHFIGKVTGQDKLSLYRNATIFILPTHGENYGNVVAESLAQGVPVICSKFAPWSDLVKYKCGYFIDNTPEEIKKSLSKYIGLNEDERNIMKRNSFSFAHNKLSVFNNSEEILDVFTR